MRQLLNVTHAATVEWMEKEEREEFERELHAHPDDEAARDGSRNVDQIAALMGGPPRPPAPPAAGK